MYYIILLILLHQFSLPYGLFIDIILIVSPHYSILTSCVHSLIRQESDRNIIQQRIIFLLDNATTIYAPKSILYMKKLCGSDPIYFICSFKNPHQSDKADILTISEAINYPVKIGREESHVFVLLTCYTIVTENWLLILYTTIQESKLGVIGPISNNAGIQSVPNQGYHNNNLPHGLSLDELVKNIQHFLKQRKDMEPYVVINYFHTLMLHNFCVMIKKEVIKKLKQEVNWITNAFNSVLMEIHKLGYEIAIVPSVYIYHTNQNHQIEGVFEKNLIVDTESSGGTLTKLRYFISGLYKEIEAKYSYIKYNASILFVLHDIAVGGGIVSVLQEAFQMSRYGLRVAISVPVSSANWQPLKIIQAMLPSADRTSLNQLIKLHKGSTFYPSPLSEDFHDIAKQYDIIVATYCMTMFSVEKVCQYNSSKLPAYYVQDYEPWTWSSPFDKQNENGFWIKESKRSYTANNKLTYLFAKTKWTAQMVHKYHDLPVHKVIPSLDHETYYPNQTDLAIKLTKSFSSSDSVINILAMIRPRTPRRNPELTLDLVLKLAYEFGNNTVINLFGAIPDDIMKTRDKLEKLKGSNTAPYHSREYMTSSKNIKMLGIVLERVEIADLYRKTDVFIDLSWWQAFGRAGVEAMACGVVAIMPLTGAAPDICGSNSEFCLYHDGLDTSTEKEEEGGGFYKVLNNVIRNDTLRHSLIINGLKRTTHYSITSAAASIANELNKGYFNLRNNRSSNY